MNKNKNKNKSNRGSLPSVQTNSVVPDNQKDDTKLRVVGIGASAGGLEALQQMVSNLPTDTNFTFIIAQHLSPSYKSMMVDLLEKDSTLPVYAPKNHELLKANTIYICPPNYNIEINGKDEIILTTYTENRHTPRPSVDILFESIAIAKGENAIGIVLSGTGTDGSRGVRAIKGEAGFSIAQDPNTAKYDGMPNSAINSGSIDLIVSPDEIGLELQNLLKFDRRRVIELKEDLPRESFNFILRKLKRQFKVDFSLYKESTIFRRIERRMTALKLIKIEDYLKHLDEHANEVSFLFNDMLIGVTSFFRDARAFEVLHSELKHYIKQKDNKVLRLWVPGCSTGEEAYSLAIILSEILGEKIEEYKIQIFATDIDKRAIDFARNGLYPESALQQMPKAYRQKYFMVNQEQMEVIKPIKTHVIFSEHDVTNDPPFLRIDLLTCRNLLIYFNLELQRQVLPVFHYALNPKGLLFLGQSESIGVFQEQFRVVSKSAKLYEAIFLGKKIPPERSLVRNQLVPDYVDTTVINDSDKKVRKTKVDDLSNLIAEAVKSAFLQYAILVNENMDIVFVQGQNPLLTRPEGVPSNNIYKNILPALSVELRSSMHLIETGKALVNTGFQKIELNGIYKWVRLILQDMPHVPGMGRLTLIFCQLEDEIDIPLIRSDEQQESSLITKEQERQLLRTKEQLQSVIEELETSNEEMQSMNEELQSSNEELQSSNEELETTNEELQSTNEELQTAYAELRVAYEDKELQQKELTELKSTLEFTNNLLEDAEALGQMGSFMWDMHERKMSWSQGCYDLFGLDEAVFQPSYEAFIGLAHPDDRVDLEDHISDLITHKTSDSFTFRSFDRNKDIIWIQLEAFVSFNNFKQAEKVIGNLRNISAQVKSEEYIEQQQKRIEYIMRQSLNGAYIYDFRLNRNTYINPAYTKILGYELDEINNFSPKEFANLFHPEDFEKVLNHMAMVREGVVGKTYPLRYRFRNKHSGEFITLYSNDTIYSTDLETGEVISMLGTFFMVDE